MRDKEIRQMKTLFQFLKEPQNSRLYGDIQAGRGLVKNNQTWLEDQDARQGQATLLPTNWLRVLDTAERSQVDQRVRHQLHAIVPLLDTFKTEQQPLELVFPRKGPFDTHPQRMDGGVEQPLAPALGASCGCGDSL